MNKRDAKNKPVLRRGVLENTSRTPDFVTKLRRLLASAVILLGDAILSATKAEISKSFAKAFVGAIAHLIKDVMRS